MKNNLPLSDSSSLSISEAARYMRSSRSYVYELIAAGKVQWFYRGQRKRIVRSSVEEFERRQVSSASCSNEPACPTCGSEYFWSIETGRKDRRP